MVFSHRSLLVAFATATIAVAFPVAAHAQEGPPAPVTGGLPLINSRPSGGDGPAQDALPADITWAAAQ